VVELTVPDGTKPPPADGHLYQQYVAEEQRRQDHYLYSPMYGLLLLPKLTSLTPQWGRVGNRLRLCCQRR
jgi:hypothetical protein